MTGKALLRHVRLFDVILATLLALTLGVIGFFVYRAAPAAHRSYSATLLEFAVADSLLTEDLYRLQAGELSHYDALVADERALRRAEHQLSRPPAHVSDSVVLNEHITRIATLVNQKLDLVEDFKSALAVLRAGMDNLPALADDVRQSPEGNQLSRTFLSDTLHNMLVYVNEPSEAHRDVVQTQLDLLTQHRQLNEKTDSPTAVQHFATRAADVVRQKQLTVSYLQAIAAVPLSATSTQLSYTYQHVHQLSRTRTVLLISALFTIMILFFGMVAFSTRWRTAQREAALDKKQQTLALALKEARAQSATLERGDAAEAVTLAEERLAALLKNTFEVVAIISREENFIFVSPAVTAMLGLSQEELIGKSVYEGIHSDDLIRVKDYLTRAQKELQSVQTVSYRLMDAHGTWHTVETFASNQYSNPAIRGVVLNTRRLNKESAP